MINIRRTVVGSDDENTGGGKGVEGRSQDSRFLHLRQERGGGRLEHGENGLFGLSPPKLDLLQLLGRPSVNLWATSRLLDGPTVEYDMDEWFESREARARCV